MSLPNADSATLKFGCISSPPTAAHRKLPVMLSRGPMIPWPRRLVSISAHSVCVLPMAVRLQAGQTAQVKAHPRPASHMPHASPGGCDRCQSSVRAPRWRQTCLTSLIVVHEGTSTSPVTGPPPDWPRRQRFWGLVDGGPGTKN